LSSALCEKNWIPGISKQLRRYLDLLLVEDLNHSNKGLFPLPANGGRQRLKLLGRLI
jgi:hypothetical protein